MHHRCLLVMAGDRRTAKILQTLTLPWSKTSIFSLICTYLLVSQMFWDNSKSSKLTDLTPIPISQSFQFLNRILFCFFICLFVFRGSIVFNLWFTRMFTSTIWQTLFSLYTPSDPIFFLRGCSGWCQSQSPGVFRQRQTLDYKYRTATHVQASYPWALQMDRSSIFTGGSIWQPF